MDDMTNQADDKLDRIIIAIGTLREYVDELRTRMDTMEGVSEKRGAALQALAAEFRELRRDVRSLERAGTREQIITLWTSNDSAWVGITRDETGVITVRTVDGDVTMDAEDEAALLKMLLGR